MNRRLMLAVPCNPMGAVDANLVEWLMHTRLDGWDMETHLERNAPVCQARNVLVKKFLASKCEVLLTIDSDQIPQSSSDKTGGIQLLLDDISREDVDIVNAITVRNSEDGPIPVIQKVREDYSAEIHTEILSQPVGLHELKGKGVVGGAAIMVKRRVLEAFLEAEIPWFMDVFVDRPAVEFSKQDGRDLFGERLIGHDYRFFMEAHKLGFRSWVDTRVFWGHVKANDMRKEYLRDLKMMKEIDKLRGVSF
jgi:hypothetical protein